MSNDKRKHIEELYNEWIVSNNHGHYDRTTEKNPVWQLFGNQDYVLKETRDIFNNYNIKLGGNVLDVGSSIGGLTYSLYNSNLFDFVAGIDIDELAIRIAQEYQSAKDISNDKLSFDTASAEKLNFSDDKFDLIIMKEVAEHVGNPEKLKEILKENLRILKTGGAILVEAPNYFFPFEPHLKIPTLPYLNNKKILRFFAGLFGKDKKFVEHLNLATPNMLENIFDDLKVEYKNLYIDYKIPKLIEGDTKLSSRFKFLSKFFDLINKFRLTKFMTGFFRVTKMHPTLLYLVIKK